MAIKELKDWSTSITGLKALGKDDTLALYSEMLATAHDLGYKVPDEQLIETEDPDALKRVIPPLHEGLVAHHAIVKADAEKKEAAAAKKAAKPIKLIKVPKDKEPATPPTKPAKKVAQKAPKEKTKMAKTAKVAAPAAKKAAKAAPAKKAAKKAAKKGAAKKAAGANARTSVGFRNPFGENAVIKVLNKDTGIKDGSERARRVAAVFKYSNKKVSAFYAGEKPPLNRTDTLRFMIDQGFISVK